MSTSSDVTPRSPRLEALREFVATENASAVALVVAAVVALAWANSPWSNSYDRLWSAELSLRLGHAELSMDLRHWIDDGLMAVFFFVVGMEIRREFDMGELRERRRVAMPVLAALGGMVVPAAIYIAMNSGQSSVRGWGIVMGTDTAFALGVLTLVGGASPRVRTFLLTLVIVDDVIALSVIAVVYTDDLSIAALAVATILFVLIVVLRRLGVQRGSPYAVLGVGVWLATLESGVHATVAGVALGLLATAYPPSADALGRAGSVWRRFREEPTPGYARTASRSLALAISPNERLQHRFHPWTSFVIVPLFALANAGVQLSSDSLRHAAGSPIVIGIVLGLVIGKIAGISGISWLVSRPWFGGFPLTIPLPDVVGVSTVAGIGFTVSLLIAGISFQGQALDDAKIGILAASLVASLVAWCAFKVIPRLSRRAHEAGRTTIEPLLIDLAEPVDPEVDHVRGSFDAPVTLVEYGDFECPHCGTVEVAMRDLVGTFRGDLAFVFRHLPLNDVHPRAQLAAEASEAAADQGSFWEMHDVLFQHQDALTLADIRTYAADLGLDVERLTREIQDRRHALRVARDLESADNSGAAGTPTFFINGLRHQGPIDFDSLSTALRTARDMV